MQKLLFFAQLISLAQNDKLLFEDEFNAFDSGMVMEKVRLSYKDNKKMITNADLQILSRVSGQVDCQRDKTQRIVDCS